MAHLTNGPQACDARFTFSKLNSGFVIYLVIIFCRMSSLNRNHSDMQFTVSCDKSDEFLSSESVQQVLVVDLIMTSILTFSMRTTLQKNFYGLKCCRNDYYVHNSLKTSNLLYRKNLNTIRTII